MTSLLCTKRLPQAGSRSLSERLRISVSANYETLSDNVNQHSRKEMHAIFLGYGGRVFTMLILIRFNDCNWLSINLLFSELFSLVFNRFA